MVPIGFAPAIPESRPAPLVRAVAAAAEARAVRRAATTAPASRRVTATVEPAEPEHPMRLGVGLLIDTFA